MEYNKERPLKVVTLCSGYDSQCLALGYLKDKHPDFAYELIAWSEIEESAIKAHNLLFPQWADRNLGDMSKIDWSQVKDFDFLTYSTPCTDYSMAGLRMGGEEGSGTRSSLLWYTRNAIIAKKPKYLMMENVKGLLTKKFMPQFQKWLQELESYGYANFWQVLNAKDYGIPQNRERVFVISIRRDEDEPEPMYMFPPTILLELTVEDVVESDVDEKFYLSQEQVNKFIGLVDMEDFVQQYEDSPEGKAGLPSKRSPISDEAEILLQQLNPDADR